MKRDIRLYIADQLVDFSDDISISYTYQLEDFENPAAIKNNFSKSITIPGTSNNNNIFGQIYKFDRLQVTQNNYAVGINFNPTQRVPFQLFRDSEIIESGYIQLNDIVIKNNIINYNITLYGGLGDFFYNLMYDNDGEKLTLSDLQYFITDSSGNTLPKNTEMNFNINKEFVYNCLNNVNGSGTQLQDFITFLPSYNGLYENFDNNKVLINTYNSNVFTTTGATDNGILYTTYNGYALGELNNEYTEWEIRDLRSYMQRPALKLSKLIETICRPQNNGGYNVNLDTSFFNNNNPYYNNTFIALPLFNTSNETNNNSESTELGFIRNLSYQNYYVGSDLTTYQSSISTPLGINNVPNIIYDSGIIDYSSLPYSTSFDINFNYSFDFVLKRGAVANEYFLGYKFGSIPLSVLVYRGYFEFYLLVTDENDTVLYQTKTNRFTDKGNESNTSNTADNFLGRFTRNGNNPIYFKTYDDNISIFNINLTNLFSDSRKIKVKIVMDWSYQTGRLGQKKLLSNSDMENLPFGYINIDFSGSYINFNYGESVVSNTLITKDKLLKTEKTPADFLIDYCKIFGLYFTKDLNSKTINILPKNNFFKNNIINIENKIDYNNNITISPQLFSDKFYRLKYEDSENYYLDKYNTEYSINYGQQRVNTNYNFNNNTKDLFDDFTYDNSISVQDKSVYFRNFYNAAGYNIPSFLTDNITYKLYYGVSTNNEKEYSTELLGYNYIDLSKTTNFNNISGYDFMIKNCYYDLDNNKQNLNDISGSLVFFNGYIQPKDINGKNINYYITDDVPEMSILNDNTPCYLYTENEYSKNGNKIALLLNKIPQFSRYMFNINSITKSLDFGKPNEVYINGINYNDNTTIYDNYWKNYLNDQLNVNTKKVTCYVDLSDIIVNSDYLRNFYYFNNCIWILNKIYDYDVNSNKTTKCDFIKVNDINNYLEGQNI